MYLYMLWLHTATHYDDPLDNTSYTQPPYNKSWNFVRKAQTGGGGLQKVVLINVRRHF